MPAFLAVRSATAPARGDGDNELLAMAPSLWPADDGFLSEWEDGRFAVAGHSVVLAGRSPLDIREAPAAWIDALYGFGWLRHVPETAASESAAHVEALTVAWLKSGAGRRGRAAHDAVLARRAISWLAHADVLLRTQKAALYDGVIAALKADIGMLQRQWRAMDQPRARLLALIALAEASLCLSGAAPLRDEAEAALAHELSPRRVAAMTGLLRNPDELAGLVLDLEALRRLFKMQSLEVPGFLIDAMARLTRTLAGLMLGDGRVARLGAPRRDPEARLTLAAVVRGTRFPAITACHDTGAGYVRLALGGVCAVLNTGAPLGQRNALELEMSSGKSPVLIHDGLTIIAGRAASGTVTVAPDPVESLGQDDPIVQLPSLQAPHSVDVDLSDLGRQHVDATHAGQARSGVVHRRRVTLDSGGRRLTGVDELRPLVGHAGAELQDFALRFVLHPAVMVELGTTQDRVELILADGQRWIFTTPAHRISVEGALYRDGLRTLPTLQILVLSGPETSRTVAWQLCRQDDSAEAEKPHSGAVTGASV